MTNVSRFFASTAFPALALSLSLACSSRGNDPADGTGGAGGSSGSSGIAGTGGTSGIGGTGGSTAGTVGGAATGAGGTGGGDTGGGGTGGGGTGGPGGGGTGGGGPGGGGNGGGGPGGGGNGGGGTGGAVPCPAPIYKGSAVGGYYEVAPCHAPPAANAAWTAEAGWSIGSGLDISLSGDRLVINSSPGHDAQRGAAGWTTRLIIPFSDPVIFWSAVDGDTLAYATNDLGGARLVVGPWLGPGSGWLGSGWPILALSGDTLVSGSRVLVKTAGAWGVSSTISPPVTTSDVALVALGHDRFALLRASDTRIIWRQGDAWTDLGSLPAAKSIAMAPASMEGTWLVLSARTAVGDAFPVSLFTLGAAGWQSQMTFQIPADAAAGSGTTVSVTQPFSDALGDLGVIAISGGPATVTFTRDSAGVVRTQDRIAVQGKALVSGRNLAILSAKGIVAGGTNLFPPVFAYRAAF